MVSDSGLKRSVFRDLATVTSNYVTASRAISLILLTLFVFAPSANAAPLSLLGAQGHLGQQKLVHRVAVFEKDDRRPVPTKYDALKRRIGLLYNGQSQILCTAFCVAPNVIATAAHCLFGSKKNRRPKLSDFSFRIEADDELSEARLAGHNQGSASHHILAGTRGLRTRPPMDAPRDWALARLSTPACKFGVLDVSPKPLQELAQASDGQKIFQIAYHWDYEHWKPAFSGPCGIKRYSGRLKWDEVNRLFSNADSLVLHTCDTGGASSGSPLLLDTSNGPTVVGINVGSYEQSRVFIKAGRIVKRTRAKIIANTGVNATAFAGLMGPLRDAAIIETNEDLRSLQLGLKTLGLYSGSLDGLFGPRTRRAIINYERRKKLPLTGLPTHALLDNLAGPILDIAETKSSVAIDGRVPLPAKKPYTFGAVSSVNPDAEHLDNFAEAPAGLDLEDEIANKEDGIFEFVTITTPEVPTATTDEK